MAAAEITATVMKLDFVPRIPLGRALYLADMPPVLAAIERGVQGGAQRIELDASQLRSISEGACRLIEAAMVRVQRDGAELCWLASGEDDRPTV